MRRFFLALAASLCLLGTCAAVLPAQEKAKEPEVYVRDGSRDLMYYTLAGIGTLLIMLVVCMPARRE
jgi:hypothetical protein